MLGLSGRRILQQPVLTVESSPGSPPPKRVPTAHEISAAGRIGRKSVEGALVGARLGDAIPHPVGKVAAAAAGAVIGAGSGVIHEADRGTGSSGAEQRAAGKPAGSSAARTVPQP